jgi:hypothetical protein
MEWTQNGHGTDMDMERIWNGYGTDMERIWNMDFPSGFGAEIIFLAPEW